MHVPAGHRFPDATGVAFASAWARHRCLQLYFSLYMYSKTDSSPLCAIYTACGGNTPKE